jgi:hypothetical protein
MQALLSSRGSICGVFLPCFHQHPHAHDVSWELLVQLWHCPLRYSALLIIRFATQLLAVSIRWELFCKPSHRLQTAQGKEGQDCYHLTPNAA